MDRPDNTASGDLWNPPDSEASGGGQYANGAASTGLAQTQAPTTSLDGNGTYWDASIMDRPDNTASGDLWNPPDSEACCGGLYANGAAATGLQTQLAAIGPIATPAKMGSEAKPVRPAPGHMLMCGHALALGAFQSIGPAMAGKDFMSEWKKESIDAANAMTPVGGFILREHVFAN